KRTISTGNRNCVVRHSKSGPLMTALGQSRQIDIPQPAGNVRFAPKAAVRSPTGAGRVERRESWPGKDVEGEIEPRPGIGERSGLSKPHVRFSREQTLVAPAKLVAFYSQMGERRAGCAKPSTELFRGEFLGVELSGVTRISEPVAQGPAPPLARPGSWDGGERTGKPVT